ncbi:GTP cyclohydrolase I FolE [Natroniella acetigena]|uniref:GTP cyclohydrolase I FolE n=1 Tax=Natroniella acetigena TaxID=52004 RepID=UPI00200B2D96|nr:GTP cyclohydrolase I FolE [Natroniella acetigena]
MDTKKIEDAVRDILEAIGEDPEREGLRNTPERVAKMYGEIFSGVKKDPKEMLELHFEDENYEELVLLKDISFYSICEHHLIPFFGKAHVAYIPKDGRVTGLSRLVKVIETIAQRPQLQERMTKTVADNIMEVLEPYGVVLVIEAEHMCMTMRGVKKPGTKTITSAVRGKFTEDTAARNEVMSLINNK